MAEGFQLDTEGSKGVETLFTYLLQMFDEALVLLHYKGGRLCRSHPTSNTTLSIALYL